MESPSLRIQFSVRMASIRIHTRIGPMNRSSLHVVPPSGGSGRVKPELHTGSWEELGLKFHFGTSILIIAGLSVGSGRAGGVRFQCGATCSIFSSEVLSRLASPNVFPQARRSLFWTIQFRLPAV